MAERRTVLAVDLGAGSGRVMAVHFDGRTLNLEQLKRFPNGAVSVRGTLYWDFLRLWEAIQEGIDLGKAHSPASIGVDTWGVDFGLLDASGNLLGNPVHYRDNRTEGMMDYAFEQVPRREIFATTGIQFLSLNTLYQLLSLVKADDPQLKMAHLFLTAPDLINYWLSGARVCEFSNATTTQLFNPSTGTWATDLMDRFGIPSHIFPEIVQPGTHLGAYEGIPVFTPACHDTGSAVAAVPASSENYAYISSGTWSLVGLEVTDPVLTDAAREANVTNEGGVYGTYRLLQNVAGMWLVEQCRDQWAKAGGQLSYDQMSALAAEAPALQSFIKPNDPRFLTPGDYPRLIQAYCAETGQAVPQTKGAIIRCILESLALKYREVLDKLVELSGRSVEVVHIVGGGSQNHLLCQMTANATARLVMAGPVEATVIGNALVQLITHGDLADIREARQFVARMEPLIQYEPQETDRWQEAYARYCTLIAQ